jgi:hypothetical protein
MAVSIISDVEVAPTDTAKLADELRSAGAQPRAAKPATASAQGGETPTEPRRFAGKSREDILNMYVNLEQHSGRLANDLGQTQRAVQELIIDKRARDLNANGVKQPTKVDPADLLQHPTEALDPFIEERVNRAISPLQQQLSRMEQMLGNSVFNNHHGDAATIMETPEFAAWVRETPLRRSIASMASQGNTQAADELLSEYKTTKQAERANAESDDNTRLTAASRVSLEQSRTGNEGTVGGAKPGKTYTRGQMRALMQSRAYETDDTLKEEVQKAYLQGRVVGD